LEACEVRKSGVRKLADEHFADERNEEIGVFLPTLIIGLRWTIIIERIHQFVHVIHTFNNVFINILQESFIHP